MDEANLLDLLINSSPLAGFAAYLVFQTKGLQRRMDGLNDKAVEREDMLRGRYDKVIADLQLEKQSLQTTNQNALAALEKKVDTIATSVDNINQMVQDLRIKDIARDVQK
tara:strand:+ start:1635 stop:1964 length:330 start_codon:yes stop_codon:yes gene_type:complete